MSNKRDSRKKVAVYIDGENVGAVNYKQISGIMDSKGSVAYANVYGLCGDERTKRWTREANKDKRLNEIRLSGRPSKNKVDKKIVHDIKEDIRKNKILSEVILVSSDHGYKDVVEELRSVGIKVTVIGKNISKALMMECDSYYDLD